MSIEDPKRVPITELKEYCTPKVFNMLERALAHSRIYRKPSVTTDVLLLTLIEEGVNIGIPLEKIKVMIHMGDHAESHMDISVLVQQVIQAAARLVQELESEATQADLGSVLVCLLELNKGPHLELFKQAGINKTNLYDNYYRSYLTTKLDRASTTEKQVSLLTRYIIVSDRLFNNKLDALTQQLGKPRY